MKGKLKGKSYPQGKETEVILVIVDFEKVQEQAEQTFPAYALRMGYENEQKLQAMCIQRNGYAGRIKAIHLAYYFGLLVGRSATIRQMKEER